MDEETRRPFVVKGPVSPTAAEVDEHEALGHVQFRNWCRHCIRAKAASNPHYRAPIQEMGTPVISMDYAFMGMDDGATMPILAIKDQNTKYMWAGVMPAKGVNEYSLAGHPGGWHQEDRSEERPGARDRGTQGRGASGHPGGGDSHAGVSRG